MSSEANTSSSAAGEKPSVALPIISLVCFLFCLPLATILSIVSYVKYKDFKGTDARTLSIVALCANILLIPMIGGICAAIAIPNFMTFQCRSKQSEAKGNLRALAVAQTAHHASTSQYSSDLKAIEFAPRGETVRYDYAVVEAGPNTYRAVAKGMRDGMAGDVWTIDQTGTLQNVESACGAPMRSDR